MRHRSWSQLLALPLLVHLLGCYAYRPTPISPTFTEQRPAAVRVTYLRHQEARGGVLPADVARVTLDRPWVSADTLWGLRPAQEPWLPPDTVGIPLADVSDVHVRQLHGGRTAAAVVGGLALMVGVVNGVRYAVWEPPKKARD